MDWPPGLKTLRFGAAFNPRPANAPTAKAGPSSSAVGRGGGAVGSGGGGAGEGLGGGGGGAGGGVVVGWAEFLPEWLEEVCFGTHFNQPVVRY